MNIKKLSDRNVTLPSSHLISQLFTSISFLGSSVHRQTDSNLSHGDRQNKLIWLVTCYRPQCTWFQETMSEFEVWAEPVRAITIVIWSELWSELSLLELNQIELIDDDIFATGYCSCSCSYCGLGGSLTKLNN